MNVLVLVRRSVQLRNSVFVVSGISRLSLYELADKLNLV